VTRRRTPPRAAQAKGFAAAMRNLHAAQAILRRYPRVLGVGLGFERKRGRLKAGRVAYVVHVARKHDPRRRADRLPDELFGIPVDVIERHRAGVRSFSAGSFVAASGDTTDFGHLGLIASDPQGGAVGVTVAHVARPAQFKVSVSDGSGGDPMSCWDLASDPAPGGSLAEAHFDNGQDIARIPLDGGPDNPFDPLLDGQARAGRPRNVTALLSPPLAVQLVVPGIDWPQGSLVEVGHQGRFDTKSAIGNATFTGLLQFEFPKIDAIEDGWSGSLICDRRNAPIALVSFGGLARTHDQDPLRATAWGWPLAPNYNFWRLSPL
jgi:hypothetical protein